MSLVNKYIISLFIICLSISVITYLYIPLYSFEGFDKALEGVLLLSSIGLGFYGACLSVLASVFNTKPVKEIMNDKEYRKEFIVVSLSTLGISFLTVFITIIYQVMLENSVVTETSLDVINAVWTGVTIGFILFNGLFILISFLIFFANDNNS